MNCPPQDSVTRLLRDLGKGDVEAYGALFPLVYGELHRLARRQRQRWRGDETLGPTALVHEAYLRLAEQSRPSWNGRAHFYAVAARAMRQILIDYARRRQARKRGGGAAPLPLDELGEVVGGEIADPDHTDMLLALEAALVRLEREEPRLARIVECRFFAGMTIPETAAALAISPATVKRGWAVARPWLYRELTPQE